MLSQEKRGIGWKNTRFLLTLIIIWMEGRSILSHPHYYKGRLFLCHAGLDPVSRLRLYFTLPKTNGFRVGDRKDTLDSPGSRFRRWDTRLDSGSSPE